MSSSESMNAPEESVKIELLRTSESEQLKKIRHTTSHVMAMAVQKLFPKAQVTIGPWIENGFYYDFDCPEPFTEKDLKAIKKEMIKIINRKLPVIREEVSREEAERRIKEIDEPYKLEILAGLIEPITLYHLGDEWWDLCAGPHLDNTSEINGRAIELESLAGAYWRGDETKAQLQRIYGTAWETPEQLEAYKHRKAEALRRDHRKLGKELGLFIFADPVGPGLPLWTPKGTILRSILEDFLKQEQIKRGYLQVVTPHIARVDLFKISGHWQKYKEDMFPLMAENAEAAANEQGFVMKPMNCPFHIQIYKSELRSYRELPMRLAEFGTVYRYEQSGELGGLTRVRGFTVDDSHLFVTPEQLDAEFLSVVDLILSVFKSLQLKNFKARLSFRDPENLDKYIGSDEAWEKAQGAIRRAVETLGMNYFEGIGEAAFYGPKLDFIFQDVLDREWQLGTVQVDYNLPERFDLQYVAEDGTRQRPVMIHRAPFGSLERLIGILIEQYAGDFPIWLAPIQVRLLPVSEEFLPFAKEVEARMKALNIRAEVESSERLGKLIRNAEKDKIPVMCVVGAKEVEANSLNIRTRASGELGAISVDEAIARLQSAISNYGNF
ncbi:MULTISPECIES: threonine--tRNA ligase [unclassified Microcoleus]|uniref:threonine--tRNA ligase n=1 Tax=unclassified Microcoleus TaxID=2642155 RepID=UPI001D38017D|nr:MULTISPECIES: threonine--tRNA ligase [unclassified Microcoleus]MCC3429809.1 threonine--tRNA ligase [Microcoleus sp. PH2017_04_SCI_O_A]MCC3441917.1 threonine--tRNA ligase [Microcoleus sp. PH2017_03_ELD_O_A]MCC3503073.1 threonine--tRNA ligase [Microcoleus sp. PH2017_19_SFW_U_A]TAE15522.1 MAG: threonine--tRNA ligase [Oscillatoriales cyanobacterium]MCC3438562.1 threonine--tRNA ligase [Microcoleus sp. PH2017_05_CCC_O_A]